MSQAGLFSIGSPSTGSGSTTGAVTANIITIPLGSVPGVYTIEARVAGFNASTPAGAGYQLIGMFRTTGLAASIIGSVERVANEEAALAAANATMVASGNNVLIQVTGVALLTIDWVVQSEYTEAT